MLKPRQLAYTVVPCNAATPATARHVLRRHHNPPRHVRRLAPRVPQTEAVGTQLGELAGLDHEFVVSASVQTQGWGLASLTMTATTAASWSERVVAARIKEELSGVAFH